LGKVGGKGGKGIVKKLYLVERKGTWESKEEFAGKGGS